MPLLLVAAWAGSLVWRHTDDWDLLSSVMGSVPLVGAAYRAFVRLAG